MTDAQKNLLKRWPERTPFNSANASEEEIATVTELNVLGYAVPSHHDPGLFYMTAEGAAKRKDLRYGVETN